MNECAAGSLWSLGQRQASLSCRDPQGLVPGVQPLGPGSQTWRGVPLGWRPISGHLAAMAAAPPSPVSGALISLRRGRARPDFCPSVVLPGPPPLLPHRAAPSGCEAGGSWGFRLPQAVPASWEHPFLQSSRQSEPKVASSRKLSRCAGTTHLVPGQGHGTMAQGPPPHWVLVSALPPATENQSPTPQPQSSDLWNGNLRAAGRVRRDVVPSAPHHTPPGSRPPSTPPGGEGEPR